MNWLNARVSERQAEYGLQNDSRTCVQSLRQNRILCFTFQESGLGRALQEILRISKVILNPYGTMG
jgi:hypothetical protein